MPITSVSGGIAVTHVLVLLLALLIGVVAGLRSLTAPAVVSWAAFLGWINLHGTWASWMGNFVTVVIVSVLAVAELVNDKRPKTPPRTVTPVFAVRIIWARSPARSSAPRGATGGAGLALGLSAPCSAPWAAIRHVRGWWLPVAATTCRSRCSRIRSRCWAGLPSSPPRRPYDTALRRDRLCRRLGGPPWIGRWCSAEGRAALLMRAPIAEPRWVGAEIACLACGLDSTPNRHQRLFETQ